ncbi:MAG: HAD-IA family hydrolase [Clostridiales bacterium]|nr:HAD-IA family hydrolase [Clostridiales bacterium]
MIKACIFDMYETLVTLFTGRIYFSDDFAAELGLPYSEYRDAWHATEDDRTTGRMTFEEGAAKALKQIGRYTPEAVALLMRKRHESQSDTFGSIPKETFELLSELKQRGIKIGLISNCFSDERDMIRASALMPYFDAVRLSYEVGIRKPVLKVYHSIAEELGVRTDECLFVGDGGSRELQGAEKAGMTPVQANWFRHLAYEPHIPSRVFPEYPQAEKQADILTFL